MLLHSQGGTFGFQVAEQRPDKIKGIVAVESATAGNIANAPKLKDVPVLMIFGDYVDQHPRWSTFKKIDIEYGDAIKAAGGTVDWINLPDIGIKGNSHMLMQDKNSDADRRGDPEMAGRARGCRTRARLHQFAPANPGCRRPDPVSVLSPG